MSHVPSPSILILWQVIPEASQGLQPELPALGSIGLRPAVFPLAQQSFAAEGGAFIPPLYVISP